MNLSKGDTDAQSKVVVKNHENGNLVWSNGTICEKSARRQQTYAVEIDHEYINPVARALNDNETWTIGDQGEFHPTIPFYVPLGKVQPNVPLGKVQPNVPLGKVQPNVPLGKVQPNIS